QAVHVPRGGGRPPARPGAGRRRAAGHAHRGGRVRVHAHGLGREPLLHLPGVQAARRRAAARPPHALPAPDGGQGPCHPAGAGRGRPLAAGPLHPGDLGRRRVRAGRGQRQALARGAGALPRGGARLAAGGPRLPRRHGHRRGRALPLRPGPPGAPGHARALVHHRVRLAPRRGLREGDRHAVRGRHRRAPGARPARPRRGPRVSRSRAVRALGRVAVALGLAVWQPALGTTYLALSPQEVLESADAVLTATVADVTARVDDAGVWTVVTLEVREWLTDDPRAGEDEAPRETVVIEVLGGEAEGRRLIVAGGPTWRPGDEVLVALHADSGLATPVVGFSQG